jgi:hypothetical protein
MAVKIYDGMNVDVIHSERAQTQVRHMFVKYSIYSRTCAI